MRNRPTCDRRPPRHRLRRLGIVATLLLGAATLTATTAEAQLFRGIAKARAERVEARQQARAQASAPAMVCDASGCYPVDAAPRADGVSYRAAQPSMGYAGVVLAPGEKLVSVGPVVTTSVRASNASHGGTSAVRSGGSDGGYLAPPPSPPPTKPAAEPATISGNPLDDNSGGPDECPDALMAKAAVAIVNNALREEMRNLEIRIERLERRCGVADPGADTEPTGEVDEATPGLFGAMPTGEPPSVASVLGWTLDPPGSDPPTVTLFASL